MNPPALIASDVDGTLLDADEPVTARTRDAVGAAIAGGATFVLATGRPPRWIAPVVDALGFAPMSVCTNGAVLYNPASDRIVSVRTLSTAVPGERRSLRARSPAPGWRSSGWAAARTTRPRHSSSARPATSTPG